MILTWASRGLRGIRRREVVEGAVALALLVALAELPPQRDVPYIVFPVLLWSALRFGPRGASAAILVVCSITVWNTAHNAGPFVRESTTDSLLATQLFIAIAALTSLVLAAVTAERTQVAAALAQSEASQRALADEQAALRRVATLVAGGAPPSRVFERVTEEVARLLGMPGASLMRYDGARTATVVGGWSEDGKLSLPVGSTFDLDGDTVVAKVLRSGSPQRVERYGDARGHLAETLQRSGYHAAVAAPVTVAGGLWGALAAATRSDEPLPEGLEQRLCDFADLVAQRLANADALEQLAASRARIVEVGDAERRRLERNLHDGAQQRLVSLALDLRMVGATLEKDPAAARSDAGRGAGSAREGARGAAGAGARHPSGGPHRTRSRAGAAGTVRARAAARRDHRAAGGAAGGPGRGGRVLRRRRGHHQRGEVRARVIRDGQHPPLQRARPRSSSPTTASAARTPPSARACAGWQTGSRRSTAGSRSTARPRAARASAPRYPARDPHRRCPPPSTTSTWTSRTPRPA